MTLSKNRFKKILKKNNFQTRKKINKKRILKKNNSFRKKKINIRKKSIKQYKKRHAKKKRKVYIRGGGNNDLYNSKIFNLLNDFMKKNKSDDTTSDISIDDENKSGLNYYNFDFILTDEKNNQVILDATIIESEFNEKAKTDEEKDEEKDDEKMKDIKDNKNIDDSTRDSIEKGKEICKSQLYVLQNGDNPISFSESCSSNHDINNWFQTIFDGL